MAGDYIPAPDAKFESFWRNFVDGTTPSKNVKPRSVPRAEI